MRGEIRALTGLRGVLAAWVVLGHLWAPAVSQFPRLVDLARPALGASLVVDTFFVLSGFVITYVYADRLSTFSWAGARDFWRHRFARIYPVYALSLAVFIAFVAVTQSLSNPPVPSVVIEAGSVLRNALFLQSLPDGLVINPPAWSLPGEVMAYALFPLLVLAVVRIRRPAVAFGLVVVLALAGAVLIATTYTDRFGYSLYELSWMRVGWAFPAGCLLARGWMLLGDRGRSWHWDLVALAGGAGVLVALLTGDPRPTFYLPPAGLPFLCLVVVGCAGATGWVLRVMSHGVVMWAGRISYSIYLTHYVVVYAYVEVVERNDLATSPVLVRLAGLLLAVGLVVVLGAAFYHLVEEPARRALSRRPAATVRTSRA